MSSQRLRGLVATGVVVAALSACSVGPPPDRSSKATDGGTGGTVTLVTHDSYALPRKLIRSFEQQSGTTVEVVRSGDAGALTNKLVLTKENPLGDVAYGVDNTFATRAVDEGVFVPYTSTALPASADQFELPRTGTRDGSLTPVDWGDVCVNVDDAWFDDHDLQPPATLDDLVDPAYSDLLVTPGAATSSPGFAFLLTTIGYYGEDGWQDYWRRLLANGARVVDGWTDAYEVDFSASGGDRPIVVSYNSSPPFTIPKGGTRPTTSALLDTCFRQVEYAGVLRGAANPTGARALVDFLVGRRVQEALPDSMYVFPVDSQATLPPLWAKWAKPAPQPVSVDPQDVTAHRSEWLRQWSDLVSG
jgi:thiamine transport system substrate-binding protein